MEKLLPSRDVVCQLLRYDHAEGAFYRRKNGVRADTGMSIGYKRVRITIGDTKYEFLAHRLAWLFSHGEWPVGEIDHIDGDRSNNKIVNLRNVTRVENARNIKLRGDNVSGFHGVIRHQSGWKVVIGGKYVGYYSCINKAILARKEAEAKYGYHVNHGRIS